MKKQLLLVLFFLALHANAQDTVRLNQVNIYDRSATMIKHQNSISFDSTTLSKYSSKTISELLNDNTPVFIKSYGNGALSTVSMRGTSSVHTNILWNGIPVNLQSTGDIDLSLISVGTFDKIKLVHGGSSSYFGSGSVGGNILLDDSPMFGQASSATIENNIGTFGKREHSASVRFNNSKISAKISSFLKENKNTFTYRNHALEGSPLKVMNEAEVKGKGLTGSLYFRQNRSTFSLHTWIEKFNREIPAAAFSINPYAAMQEDYNIRNMLAYKYVRDKFVLNARTAVISTELSYLDTTTKVDSKASILTFFPEISLVNYLKKGTLISGVNSSLNYGRNTNYLTTHSRKNIGIFSGYFLPFKKAELSLNVREDLYDGNLNAFTFNSSFSYKLKTYLKLNLAGGNTFRAPSLNDLYWIPGGNPELKPEKGWFAQNGIQFEKVIGNHNFNINGTVYSNFIDNWIIWLPETPTIWTPRNLKKVWSRGIEFYVKDEIDLNRVVIRINASYSYTEATNTASYDPSVIINDQIIYVPYYTANGSGDISYKNLSIRYSQYFIGGRYIASDHTAALPSYSIANIRVSYKIHFSKQSASLFGSINNLYNLQYQVIENRPMPGRQFEAGLTLNLIQP